MTQKNMKTILTGICNIKTEYFTIGYLKTYVPAELSGHFYIRYKIHQKF